MHGYKDALLPLGCPYKQIHGPAVTVNDAVLALVLGMIGGGELEGSSKLLPK